MSERFIKVVENFVCDHCGREVEGSGFTNHCPYCLWSKHVDRFPGDRKSSCGGMMEPVDFIKEGSVYSIIHRCQKCGYEKKNKLAPDDDFDIAVQIVKNKSETKGE